MAGKERTEIDFTGADDESNPDYLKYIDQHTYRISGSECQIWIGRSNKGTYLGGIQYKGKYALINRLIHKWFSGKDVPKGMTLKTTCNNSLCINPRHLYQFEAMTKANYERCKNAGTYHPINAHQKSKVSVQQLFQHTD